MDGQSGRTGEKGMEFIIAIIALVILDLLAVRYGADSRDLARMADTAPQSQI